MGAGWSSDKPITGTGPPVHLWTHEGKKACDPKSTAMYKGPKIHPLLLDCCVHCLQVWVNIVRVTGPLDSVT